MLRSGRGPTTALLTPLRRACSTNAGLRAEIVALKAQITSLGSMPAAPKAEQSFFAGAASEYTTKLKFFQPHLDDTPTKLPCFRLINDMGLVCPGAELPMIDKDTALAMQITMVRVSEFDKVFNDAQRQGRISFYLTSRGEEACSVASAAALSDTDFILPQYRELGAAFWRGFTFEDTANQLCSNSLDPAKGRQLPLHIGDRSKRFFYVKSTLGTQCPHAVGAAQALRLMGNRSVALTYFGEGCASEGDIPSALNIAAVHKTPTIFFCRNNGYAISTQVAEQYSGDGVAPRGLAFGMPAIRVDGNDPFAVYAAVQRAREMALEDGGGPAMIEAMTYRIGAHSTSDDDSKYRNPDSPEPGWDSERAYWESRSPIIRFGRYLQAQGWYDGQQEEELRKQARKDAIRSLNVAQKVGRPHTMHLFSDVYDEVPWNLEEQEQALLEHMQKYPSSYTEHIESNAKELERWSSGV